MALFLETTYSSSSYKGNLTDVAFDGIFLMQEDMQLMEAIYQADFIMHEQNKNLSESARVLKEGNFFMNVFTKVKEWIIKAWQWLKNFVNKIWDKIVEIYNRIKDHLTGNTKDVANKVLRKAEIENDAAKTMISMIKTIMKFRTLKEVEDYSKKIEKVGKDVEKKLADADKLKGTTKISMTYADKLKTTAQSLKSELEELAKDSERDLAELEKEVTKSIADGDHGDSTEDKEKATKENSDLLNALRAIVRVISKEVTTYSKKLLDSITAVYAGADKAVADTSKSHADAPALKKEIETLKANLAAAMKDGKAPRDVGNIRARLDKKIAAYNALT